MAEILSQLDIPSDPNVLVGTHTADDAGVYRLSENLALVQTVDFFTAMVDDPYDFGRVAAANALSDVYAMGARPVTALNIIGFPEKKLPMDILLAILRGGLDKATEAGVSIVGGHTIKDDEPKYGLAVTGLVDPARLVTNSGARPGDRVFLTKPLGSGIMTTAIKQDLARPSDVEEVTALMAALNRPAAEVMTRVGVHAATDVTGFGLLGHLHEMLEASGAAARIRAPAVPVLAGVWDFARKGAVPGGSKSNLDYFGGCCEFDDSLDEIRRIVLADAQTSGGLLISVPPERADALRAGMEAAGVRAAEIGEVVEGTCGRIRVDA